jgi:uroporphyrinogen-III synthase
MPAGAAHRAATLFGTPPPPDAVLFTSGSTVAHLGEALRAAGLQFPPGTALVSIGPVTTAALRSAGLDADREALRPSPREMVQACLDLFAGSQ